MLGDLTGKTALVTGAGSGIGRGIALMLAAQNASVAVTDVDEARASEVADEVPGTTMARQLDVTDAAAAQRVVDSIVSTWGALDILVNNAGVGSAANRTVGADREEDWDVTFAINVKGTVHCCDAVIPHMRERRSGKIITIASMAGHAGRRSTGAYAASKAAVLRYSKGLAATLAPDNINVNVICPGAVWTRFQEAGALARQKSDPSLAGQNTEQIFEAQYQSVIPLGRPQTPEDIGKMAAFLTSEDACNVTGQCIHVDGGVILRD
ncbi:MAG: SDR family oxidoreductase [Chloroflexi bacterium]|nr:SDR family oxidoreductase [Chloroflexota bacterium]